ncbi:dephospho-CoA kinase [Salinibacterium xinjiangense]|uniref:Dephospho-CoA kinase n=2 Tax=Salinibacterium xinjiangense TaxID=386302 RepID=A0A2C9A349_9MICO|nr:dephospho-CoA kinase [Salinibacterium xinjiangense]SOE73743.1 dephospho-CoA kinase [Salinibacterium xinjiangense]
MGLTGGIASGKSVVARRLGDLGAVVVDADQVAREVVEPGTPALAAIAAEFGDDVILADGSLDRAALGALIFSNPAKRAVLNGITHPAVYAASQKQFAAAGTADPAAVVVYDVPLLAEGTRADEFDLVVVVHASTDTRVQRMVELRGYSRDDALRRIGSQASDADRLAIADVVIDSDGTLEETMAQADKLWATVTASAESKHR